MVPGPPSVKGNSRNIGRVQRQRYAVRPYLKIRSRLFTRGQGLKNNAHPVFRFLFPFLQAHRRCVCPHYNRTNRRLPLLFCKKRQAKSGGECRTSPAPKTALWRLAAALPGISQPCCIAERKNALFVVANAPGLCYHKIQKKKCAVPAVWRSIGGTNRGQ